jgi:hypothetical protein
MMQFYFLTVFLNGLCGFSLVAASLKGKGPAVSALKTLVGLHGYRLVVGILTALWGILSVANVTPYDTPVIGDLFPAVSGFLSGVSLVASVYRDEVGTNLIDRLLVGPSVLYGVIAMVSSVLHLVLPYVIIL